MKQVRRLGVALLCGALMLAIPATADDLRSVLRRTYQSNPTIRADRMRGKAVKESVNQVRSQWAPQVRIEGNKSLDLSATIVRPDPPGQQNPKASASESVAIRLSKPLYDGGANQQRVKEAQANVGASKQQTRLAEQQVLFEAVQAYVDVVRDRLILRQREHNLKVLKELASATARRFAVGEVTKTDVAQANARTSGAKAAVAGARAALAASEAKFERVVGGKPSSQLSMPGDPRLPSSLENALRLASQINPQILAAAHVEDAARHNLRATKADAGWRVDFSASLSASGQFQFSPVEQRSATAAANMGISASKTLSDGGLSDSRTRQASYTVSQRNIEKIVAVRLVRENVKAAWNSYVATTQSIAAAKEQVAATQQALESVRIEYTVGSRSTVDVLNVQQELVNSQLALINARHDRILASYQLLTSMGRLTGPALGF